MRKYQVIWNKLKTEGRCSLEAHPDLHSRIIKAVWKERSKDLEWQLRNSESAFKHKLLSESKFTLLSFRLVREDTLFLEKL